MLKDRFLEYQHDLNNDIKLNELITVLKPKILSIFRSINCHYSYRELFIQDCIIKIFELAKSKKFNKDILSNFSLDSYFEKSFLTVRRNFIKDYSLFTHFIDLNTKDKNGVHLYEKISDNKPQFIPYVDITDIIDLYRNILTKDEINLLHISSDGSRVRSKVEIGLLLGITHQAVSKRYKKIRKKIKESK